MEGRILNGSTLTVHRAAGLTLCSGVFNSVVSVVGNHLKFMTEEGTSAVDLNGCVSENSNKRVMFFKYRFCRKIVTFLFCILSAYQNYLFNFCYFFFFFRKFNSLYEFSNHLFKSFSLFKLEVYYYIIFVSNIKDKVGIISYRIYVMYLKKFRQDISYEKVT